MSAHFLAALQLHAVPRLQYIKLPSDVVWLSAAHANPAQHVTDLAMLYDSYMIAAALCYMIAAALSVVPPGSCTTALTIMAHHDVILCPTQQLVAALLPLGQRLTSLHMAPHSLCTALHGGGRTP